MAILIQQLRKGKASDQEKEMLEQCWQNALNDTSVLEEMSAASCEELKRKLFHAIQVRLGLK